MIENEIFSNILHFSTCGFVILLQFRHFISFPDGFFLHDRSVNIRIQRLFYLITAEISQTNEKIDTKKLPFTERQLLK